MKSILKALIILIAFLPVTTFSINNKPLGFEENKGQIINNKGEVLHSVLFRTENQGTKIYITTSGISYFFADLQDPQNIPFEEITVLLKGANIDPLQIKKDKKHSFTSTYYNEYQESGILDVATFSKITISNVYPNIDWVFHSNEDGIKYDFVLHPGADPELIKMQYQGAKKLSLANPTKLQVDGAIGQLIEGSLYTHYMDGEEVSSRYRVRGDEVTFQLKKYDNTKTVIIDPPLIWSTYVGGSTNSDQGHSVTTDAIGNLYVRGFTSSLDFPLKSLTGAYNQALTGGGAEMFIMKFDPNGVLLWSTYYGGLLTETAYLTRDGQAIAFDETNQYLYVVGGTNSVNFPTFDIPGTTDFFQSTHAGGYDGYVVKFNSSGQRLWATYYGGTGNDYMMGVDVGPNGNAVMMGRTTSDDLFMREPGEPGGYFQPLGGASILLNSMYILQFTPQSELIWATYYGGLQSDNGGGINVDQNNNIYIGGISNSANFPSLPSTAVGAYFQPVMAGSYDAFVVKFNGKAVRQWATLYGGAGFDRVSGVTTDPSGNVYLTGVTSSLDFPIQNQAGAFNQPVIGGNYDVFILKFDSNLVRKWATYYGGLLDEGNGGYLTGPGIACTSTGDLYVSGKTLSLNFATQNEGPCSPFQSLLAGSSDMFLLRFDANGVRKWSTLFGSIGDDNGASITIDGNDHVYVTGHAAGSGFPTRQQGPGSYFQSSNAGATTDMIIVKVGDPILNASFSNSIACFGDSTSFTNTSLGSVVAYEWNFGEPSSGVNNTSVLANPKHKYAAPGTYNVQLIISEGCVNDTVIQSVVVKTQPKITKVKDTVVCDSYILPAIAGSSLTGSQAYYTGSNGTGTKYLPGVTLNNSALLYVYDQNGLVNICKDQDTFNLTVNKSVIIQNVQQNCNLTNTGYTVSFTATGGNGGSYTVTENAPGTIGGTWIANTWTSNEIANGVAYDFDIGQNNNCTPAKVSGIFNCACVTKAGTMDLSPKSICGTGILSSTHNGNQTLEADDKLVFVLHTKSGAVLGTVLDTNTTPSFNFFDSLSYGVTYYISAVAGDSLPDGRVDFGSVCTAVSPGTPVTWKKVPTATIGTNQEICSGEDALLTFNFTGNGNFNVNYTDGISNYDVLGISNGAQITVNPTSNTTYSLVSVQDNSNTCSGTVSGQAIVSVNELPVAEITSSKNACINLEHSVSFGGNAPASSTYNWNFSGGTIVSGTGAGPYEVKWSSLGNKEVSLTVISDKGCSSATVKKTITVSKIPSISFTADEQICDGDTAVYIYNGDASPSATYNWSFDGGDIMYSSGKTEYGITWPATGTKKIGLRVIDAACASDTLVKTTKIFILPKALFSYEKDSSLNVQFNGDSTNGVYQWEWDFGDRSPLSTERNPSHEYAQQDSFDVILVVWNQCGSDTITFTVVVDGKAGNGGNTSIEHTKLTSSWNVYPNPFSNKLFLEIQLEKTQTLYYTLTDVLGRTVVDKSFGTFSKGKHSILVDNNLSAFQPGLWILRVYGDELNWVTPLIKE